MRKLEISNPNGFLSMPQITSFDSIAHSVHYYFRSTLLLALEDIIVVIEGRPCF